MPSVTKIDGSVFLPIDHSDVATGSTLVGSKYGGGKGGGGIMEPQIPIKDYIDARDDAVESRLSAMIDKLPNQTTLIVNVWGGVAAILATVLAVLAFGADRFDGGVGASALVRDSQAIQATTDIEQDIKLQLMDDKLDLILKQTASK